MMRQSIRLFAVIVLAFFSAVANAQGEAMTPPVYLDSFLNASTMLFAGYERYHTGKCIVNARAYEHCLITGAQNHTAPGQRYSWLTLNINAEYERFTAQVGRDDNLALYGPAYCYFEVWGDGVQLFKSEAIRPAGIVVVTDGMYGPNRKVPQSIDISVRGVKTLQLITRYATEFNQSARHIHRALGCIWAEARLLPTAGTVAKKTLSPQLRDAVRRAVASAMDVVEPRGIKQEVAYRVAIAPIRIEQDAIRDGVVSGTLEDELRLGMLNQVCVLKRANGVAFAASAVPDAKAIADALPVGSPLRLKPQVVASIAQGANTDFVLFSAIDGRIDEWSLSISVFDVAQKKIVRQTSIPIAVFDRFGKLEAIRRGGLREFRVG